MPNSKYYAGLDILGLAPVTAKPVIRFTPVPSKPVTKPPVAGPKSPAPVAKPASTSKPVTKPAIPAAKVKAVKTKAANVANKAKAVAAKLDKHAAKKPLARSMSTILKKNAAALTTAATKIKGWDVFGTDDADNVDATSTSVDHQTAAADIATQIFASIDPLYAAGKDDLAREGETIVNACNYIVVTLEEIRRSMGAM